MAKEARRGCGYRKYGGLYLVGRGIAVVCDGLPLTLDECGCCGYAPAFYRGFTWVKKQYIAQLSRDKHTVATDDVYNVRFTHCACKEEKRNCPVCCPETNDLEKYGIMWVGTRDYTPKSFIREAENVGVSKRINKIPKGLELGKTWVVLAHPSAGQRKVPVEEGEVTDSHFETNGAEVVVESKTKFEPAPAIFYAFIPQRVEMPIRKSKATPEKLEALKKQGITPIVLEDDPDHE